MQTFTPQAVPQEQVPLQDSTMLQTFTPQAVPQEQVPFQDRTMLQTSTYPWREYWYAGLSWEVQNRIPTCVFLKFGFDCALVLISSSSMLCNML